MPLQIYNSLSQKKEKFIPNRPDQVSIYVCGPTVYSETHVGHGKTYTGFDVILRYFQFLGYKTFYVQNITDVGHLVDDSDDGEDKILKKSREANKEPMAIAEYYAGSYFSLMDALGLQRPDISPRASGHIPEQLEAIEKMVDQGSAYEVNGSIYFDISRDPSYGRLSNRSQEDMLSGTRVGIRSEKRNPNDFALWKHAEKGHLMRWKDPWGGFGYPGWHTECVVMSSKYLGDQFDIHGGGMDLKFPHHESELAQARSLGQSFAKYWMHSNMLTINGQKMSKSLGNYVTLAEACQTHGALAIRYFILASHYRSVVDYSESSIQNAKLSLLRLHQITGALRQQLSDQVTPGHQHFQEYRQRFCEAMDDDFATPQALAVLFELTKEANSLLNESSPNPEAIADAEYLFSTLGGEVLGVIPQTLEQESETGEKMDQVMQLVIQLRKRFRENKDFAASDFIRDQLHQIGIQLEDGKEGTSWKLFRNEALR
ncbi:MAG: cysteine--tRNA ligase [SAR324 cluster bacterium]|nr:cysteine--tRNA ligase [SAR324 cluster bacterium]